MKKASRIRVVAGIVLCWLLAALPVYAGEVVTTTIDSTVGGGAIRGGNGSMASGSNSSAYGTNSNASGYGSSAYGDMSGYWGSGSYSSAYGSYSMASGANSSAYGYFSRASGESSSAYGYYSEASGASSVAIGNNARARGTNSVALGAGSFANEDNTVSVGSYNFQRRIINVADGEAPTDAANVGQLGMGVAAALAIPQVTPSEPGKKAIGVQTGTYNVGSYGEWYWAFGAGFGWKVSNRTVLNLGASTPGKGNVAARGSMTVEW